MVRPSSFNAMESWSGAQTRNSPRPPSSRLAPSAFMRDEKDRGQRRECQGQRIFAAMQRNRCGLEAANISLSASAVERGVAIERLVPFATAGDADLIIVPRNRREIEHRRNDGLLRFPNAQQAEDRILGIAAIDPFESRRIEIELVHRRRVAIELVQV